MCLQYRANTFPNAMPGDKHIRFLFAWLGLACYYRGQGGKKRMTLTLKPFASLRTGLIGPGRVFQYGVVGGERGMSIANMGLRRGWQIYRWDGLGWKGSYKTAEEDKNNDYRRNV
jgi:hypothetical protein